MKRGNIWTIAVKNDYAGKPRPAVIVQNDSFADTDSVSICSFTTAADQMPLFRLLVKPNNSNGLRKPCKLMVDKITTVPKSKLGVLIGRLDDEDMLRLNRAMLVFFGLTESPPTPDPA